MAAHQFSPKAHTNAPIPNVLVPLLATVDQPALLKRHQLARALNMSCRSIDNLQARKLIPYVRLSPRLIRFHLPSVLAALGRFEVRAVSGRPQHKS